MCKQGKQRIRGPKPLVVFLHVAVCGTYLSEMQMAAMQQLSLKERFVVTEYALKGKPFKEIAQETGLKEKGVASAYYRSIKKLRAEMGDVK